MYDVIMHRTQLSLSEHQYRFLADEAGRAGVSMSELIRRWVTARMESPSNTPLESDSAWAMVGIGRGGPGRVSEQHDRLLAEIRQKRRPGPGRRPG